MVGRTTTASIGDPPLRRSTLPRMSPAPSRVRLRAEALRAFAGLWLVVVSLLAAPAFYRWSEHALPDQPSTRLLGAFALAALACVGLGVVTHAGVRVFLTLLAPRPRTIS